MTFLCVSCVFSAVQLASATSCDRTQNQISLYYPIRSESSSYEDCWSTYTEDEVVNGAGRFEIPEGDIHLRVDNFVTDNPTCTFSDMQSQIPNTGTLFWESHGRCTGTGGALTQYYYSTSERDEVWRSLPDTTLFNKGSSPHPFIGILGTGIGTYFASSADPQLFVGGFYCCSSRTLGNWGVPEGRSSTPGRTLYSYTGNYGIEANCHNMRNVIESLGCYKWPGTGHQAEDPIDGGGFFVGLELHGYEENQYRCGMDCWDWAAHFCFTEAAEGEVRFAVLGEDAESHFFVLADGDTIATFPGVGSDGYGIIRCYAVPASGNEFTVVEVDGTGFVSMSDPFTWSDDSSWPSVAALHNQKMQDIVDDRVDEDSLPDEPIMDGPDRYKDDMPEFTAWHQDLTSREVEYGNYTEHVLEGGGRLTPPCEECADVVVVAPPGYWFWALDWAKYQIQAKDPSKKVRLFQTDGNRWDPRDILIDVAEANVSFNQQWGTSYPDGSPAPYLLVLGDEPYLDIPEFPDDEFRSCMEDSCHSFTDLTDLDGDHKQDGSCSWIPADNDADAIEWLVADWKWNRGEAVRTDGRLLTFCGDVINSEPAPWMSEPLQYVQAVYRASSLAVGPFLRYSDIPDRHQWAHQGFEAIRSGVRDIWLLGFQTDYNWYTSFLYGYDSLADSLEVRQIVNVYAVGCETGAFWKDELWGPSVAQQMAVNEYGTQLAGALVNINGGQGQDHEEFMVVYCNELQNAPAGTLQADVTRFANRTYQEQNVHYGRGVVWLGGYTGTRNSYSTDVEETAPHISGLNLTCRPRVDGWYDIRFSLASAAEVAIDVYDVSGRLVSHVKHDTLAPGSYVYTWFGKDSGYRPVSSGVYLVRLVADGRGETAKAVVVK